MTHTFYSELAPWWHLLSPPEDYAEEAAFFTKHLKDAGDSPARTLLELGSGGGNNAFHMKADFDLTLVDLSPDMLTISQSLNPECKHIEGDMRTVRLDCQFDGVFVHDAVVYMTTETDLHLAMETAYMHCRPGGAVLFAPDHLKETFYESADVDGTDEDRSQSLRGIRSFAWTFDPDPDDTTYTVDYAHMVHDTDGTTRIIQEQHVEGLFSRATWLRLLSEVGFAAKAVPFDHSEVEPGTYEVFVCIKPV